MKGTSIVCISIEELKTSLIAEGWCVIKDIIPADAVPSLIQAVLELVGEQRAEREKWLAATRAGGKQSGVEGVENAQGVINHIPACAPYLADRRILEVVEAFFGPYMRVSSTGAIVTNPNNRRGHWHADWPFNQGIASHIPAPYGDFLIHLSSLFMLTDFSAENGGTLIVPGSHRLPHNPSGDSSIDRNAPHPNEINVTGKAGSVFLFDSRLWHSAALNRSDQPRVALSVRYAPWWLNLDVRRKGSPDNQRIVVETNGRDNSVPLLSKSSYESLPENVKPLFRHWVEN